MSRLFTYEFRVRFEQGHGRSAPVVYRKYSKRSADPPKTGSLRFQKADGHYWLKIERVDAVGRVYCAPDGLTEEELIAAGWKRLRKEN